MRAQLCMHAPRDDDVNGTSSSVRTRRRTRRRQRDVVVMDDMSTLEREVDVCARTNFVTNGLPYGEGVDSDSTLAS